MRFEQSYQTVCISVVLLLAISVRLVGAVEGAGKTDVPQTSEARYLAMISDLHMGLGRKDTGEWHRSEDFRWPNALKGLLDYVSNEGQHKTDLIVVGDFLELWRPPEHVKCLGVSPELGCTIKEMEKITSAVIKAHPEAFQCLREFSQRGENRLHIIPGNHDSSLVLDRVWGLVAKELEATSGRINLERDGIWESPDGRILVEHGHQIGRDANRYDDWPTVVRRKNGVDYVIRPWGERFVQKLFNKEEQVYSIIDNLAPETTGLRYRMADRGLWGNIADVARFIHFNLVETSLDQKRQYLGPEDPAEEPPAWDIDIARKLGHKLFVESLAKTDPFRSAMLSDKREAQLLRRELDLLARDPSWLPDADVRSLCDQMAIKRASELCQRGTLGYRFEARFIPRKWVMKEHLLARRQKFKRMRAFIYGHTHKLEEKWPLKLTSLVSINVFNTGAFQRVVDEEGFLRRALGMSPGQALRSLTVDVLPPCYTVVLVRPYSEVPVPVTKQWYQPEDDTGQIVSPGSQACK